jgi:hypothetical protein
MRLAALLASLAVSSAAPTRADEATPVDVAVGRSVKLCAAGVVMCPAAGFFCDDPKFAIVENGPEGAELKGVSPGTTTCSVMGSGRAFRRVFRVTVRPAASGAAR